MVSLFGEQTTANNNNNNGASGAPGGLEKQISSYWLSRLRGEEKETHKQSVVGTKNKQQQLCAKFRFKEFIFFRAKRGKHFEKFETNFFFRAKRGEKFKQRQNKQTENKQQPKTNNKNKLQQ